MKRGFTLIELAIVLVIIGLIAGGTLLGKDLIRAAEIRNVLTEIDQIKTAANTFKLKYNALPGDMANAGNFWPLHPDCPDVIDYVPQPATCNGDDNAFINMLYYDGGGAPPSEPAHTMQQLGSAGLIPGLYSPGIDLSSSFSSVNAMSSKMPGGSYAIFSDHWPVSPPQKAFTDTAASLIYYNTLSSRNFIYFAKKFSGSGIMVDLQGGILTPLEAYNIDKKIDDGKPGTGAANTMKPGILNCSSSNNADIAEYVLLTLTQECILLIALGL